MDNYKKYFAHEVILTVSCSCYDFHYVIGKCIRYLQHSIVTMKKNPIFKRERKKTTTTTMATRNNFYKRQANTAPWKLETHQQKISNDQQNSLIQHRKAWEQRRRN